VTIEILKGDVLRFTQIDREGRTNVVTFSDRFDVRRGGFDVTARPTQPLKAEG
jgi:acyl CoA:acetate/3-ketoacid CoA transferase